MRTVRPTRLIIHELKGSPVDAGLQTELQEALEHAKPFGPDGKLKGDWASRMSVRHRQILERWWHVLGEETDDRGFDEFGWTGNMSRMIHNSARCFRGRRSEVGGVIQSNDIGGLRVLRYRCPWMLCPKTSAPDRIEKRRRNDFHRVVERGVRELESPRFHVVVLTLTLDRDATTDDAVRLMYAMQREKGGFRFSRWLSRSQPEKRMHPIIGGKFIGEVSFAIGRTAWTPVGQTGPAVGASRSSSLGNDPLINKNREVAREARRCHP
jgi:hypothetical protein